MPARTERYVRAGDLCDEAPELNTYFYRLFNCKNTIQLIPISRIEVIPYVPPSGIIWVIYKFPNRIRAISTP